MSGGAPALTSPTRRLLAGISALLADGDVALSRVLTLIAQETLSDVCSAYALRPGEVLELRAGHGLRSDAVGRTRLRVGEGIVGLAAATGECFNLADAQNHPAYAARLETGEANFASLLAMPVRSFGRTLGVMVIQNRLPRRFTEEEVEGLQTVTLLLAEFLHRTGGVGQGEATQFAGTFAETLPTQFDAVPLSPGIAVGEIIVGGTRKPPRRVIADDSAVELARLTGARLEVQAELKALMDLTANLGDAEREVMATTQQLAADEGFARKVEGAIADGLTAEAALHRVLEEMRVRMRRINDPYLRERLADIEDAAGRLIRHLDPEAELDHHPGGKILLVRRLGPAELLSWHAKGIAGALIEEGSKGGHAAILARALGLPLLGGGRGAIEAAQPGGRAILDGDLGLVILRPEAPVLSAYDAAISARAARSQSLSGLRDTPSITRDGLRFHLMINAGLLAELDELAPKGAEGVGLFRTEIALMARPALRDPAEMAGFYARVMDAAGGRPVVFRTLDLGSDKLLPDAARMREENPAMGWRSLRVGLDRPAVLRSQLRALLLAAGGRELSVMFPMVASLSEFRRARSLLLAEAARVRPSPASLQVGAMLEVPALLFQLKALMREADFVSVGSNDLLQFLFAADRGTPGLADRYDFLSPSMIDALEYIALAARDGGALLSLCGEAASRPLDALVLLALGFRRLSMAASSLLVVKSALRNADIGKFRQFLTHLRHAAGAQESLRDPIAAWARDHGLDLSD